ncbi:DNA translocase FtsK 4TM domain-containing protein [Vreelandella rituensis]
MGLKLQGSVREGVVVVLLASCTFLLLALFSYQSTDPGWSHRGPESAVENWMGSIGAWLADVLYSLFGASALWWPGMLGFAAWWLIRSRQVRFDVDPVSIAVHAGGLLLLILGTTTLGALHFYHPESSLPYASGGILGEGLVSALLPLLGSGGVGLVAVAFILSGFPLFTGMSWLTVADKLGSQAYRLGGWLKAKRNNRPAKPAHHSAFAAEGATAEAAASKNDAVRQVAPESPVTPSSQDNPSASTASRREPSLGTAAGSNEADRTAEGQRSAKETTIPWEATEEETLKPAPAVKPEPVSSRKEPSLSAWAAEPDNEPAAELSGADKPSIKAFEPREIPQEVPATPQEPELKKEQEAELDPVPAEPELKPEPEPEPEPESRPTPQPVSVSPPAEAPLSPADMPEKPLERERVPEVVPEPVWDDEEPEPLPTFRETPAAPREKPPEEPRQEERYVSPPEVSIPEAPEREALEEVASTANAGDEPALWTVEHLQSQRPVFEDMPEPEGELPSLRLLTPPTPHQPNYTEQQLADMAELLEVRLREYGVKAEVVDTWPGPVITRFEIKPAAGVKVSKISNLAKDLARSLMVKSVRVVEVIPGRPTVGIEIPNPHRAMIRLREVIDSERYQQETSPLTMALGQDIGGGPVVANLGKMPHLLVAGTTGSGKSVGVNAMLISMLLKATPDELKLIMVDPKMLELSVYDGIPHLLAPVVTDMKEAANALRWCVAEMERRYKLMAAMGVRNIAGFNARLDEAKQAGAQVADPLWEPQPWEMHQTPPILEKLPYIVVVIDEFADMFMIVGKKVEELIARLAQKARAAGIHLILATQRPSVDVVTGLIKANIPSRMAFQVSSRIDSRTILDQGGAESLLGHGDMLYLPAGSGPPNRIHGAFVDDDEVHRVVDDWKRRGEPQFVEEILSGGVSADALTGLEAEGVDGDDAEKDALYDEAVQFVTETRRASISAVQRRFKIGYNRAARLVEAMEGAGVVTSMGTNGAREVLAPPPVGH